MKIYENRHLISNFLQNIGFYVKRTGDKLGVDSDARKALHQKVFVFPSSVQGIDVLLSRYFFPIRVLNSVPLVYHHGFPTNQYVGVSSTEQRREAIRDRNQLYRNTAYTLFSTRESIRRFSEVAPKDVQKKVVYAPYFLPKLEPIQTDSLEKKFSDYRPVRVLFVGSDGTLKGVHNLVEALNRICDQYPDVRDNLKATIITRDELPTCDFEVDKHEYLNRDEVLEAFRQSHIFCMPTLKDSYGLVYIEAMASGCAVVADDSPVRREILNDGDAGLMSDPQDPDDIADKLISIIQSPGYGETLARRARNRFKKNYHWKPVGKKYIDVLESAAQKV
ncbi:Glycosyl transferase, group 1 [Salinibacter ruber M8]|uniref:Glycosyl transferase, group 1 n=1 Tax=Salinibacter ruber (strain M8) TaxID=761659 RepID=D5H572_SALRM|nr:Glycosyl transferase, group 1 [Salinibacter ruber M8]